MTYHLSATPSPVTDDLRLMIGSSQGFPASKLPEARMDVIVLLSLSQWGQFLEVPQIERLGSV